MGWLCLRGIVWSCGREGGRPDGSSKAVWKVVRMD
jgi:hypothetical protein